MRSPIILYLFAFALVFSACKKEEDNNPAPNNNNNNTPPPGAYMPLTEGNYWEYQGADWYNLEVTGDKTTLGTLPDSFFVLHATGRDATHDFFARHDGQDIYQVRKYAGHYAEVLILKAGAKEGATWVSEFTAGNDEFRFENKIVKKGLTREVMGKTYKKVIHVHRNEFDAFGKYNESDLYFAEGIGMIQVKYGLGNSKSTTSLASYTIK